MRRAGFLFPIPCYDCDLLLCDFLTSSLCTLCECLNRIKYKKGRHNSDLCTLTILDLLFCIPLFVLVATLHFKQCSILLTEISSKAPGFIKCWPRCLNVNLFKASQSKRTLRLFQMPVSSVTMGTVHQPHFCIYIYILSHLVLLNFQPF
jgi:phage FluMu protein Com